MNRWLGALALLLMCVPTFASAILVGGPINQLVFCYNNAIYAGLGAPRGGPFIWTQSTKTYQFGPPRQVGQYLLGLAAPPYYCIVSRDPVIVWSGILITMMGSSGAPAPSASIGQNSFSRATPSAAPQAVPTQSALQPASSPPLPQTPSIGHVVISEIFYAVDSQHGNDPANEWVELYNGSNAAVSLSGWSIADAVTTRTIPGNVILQPNTFLILVADSATASKWRVPPSVQVISLNATIGNGLDANGDRVVIKTPAGQLVDSVSWGNDNSIFNPAPQAVVPGHSMARGSLIHDTHSAADWIDLANPTPGN